MISFPEFVLVGKKDRSGNLINVYCDESCHLENDNSNIMVIGGIWCPKDKVLWISERIKKLKAQYGFKPQFEIKWIKVSPSKIEFYSDLIKLFFEEENLHLRCLIVSDKSKLKHTAYHQDHNTFYDKMYYLMLTNIIDTCESYDIYIDIKDTHTYKKSLLLTKYLRNTYKDYDGNIIRKIQPVDSSEIQLMQLVDILIGAISYINRNLATSESKVRLTEEMKLLSNLTLIQSTNINSKKVNVFVWNPS